MASASCRCLSCLKSSIRILARPLPPSTLLARLDAEFGRLDDRRADHRAYRNAIGQKHTRRFDRGEPKFDVLVFGHELGPRPVRSMAGDRHVAARKNRPRAGVTSGLPPPQAYI